MSGHRVMIIQGTSKYVATETEKSLDQGWEISDPIIPTGQKIRTRGDPAYPGCDYEAQLMAVLFKLEDSQ
jgi:hypothetical protein